ncbi:MAG: cyclic 2,3-diphosphoglycerate synthase [Thermoplasmatota archaeon]
MGAAGRDFHNFNLVFRSDPGHQVVAFTAAQIPDIAGRSYPPVLAGPLYPEGIPILPEEELPKLIRKHRVDEVVFSYSDISHVDLMHKASLVLALGADFRLLGTEATMLRSRLPLISVCAVRTGAGKSQTTRAVSKLLKDRGYRVVAIRHPMPYGELSKQVAQRYATYEDMDREDCTIEEREEYEPHIANGVVVYAGVDYKKILQMAEREADVILWDGGNNDTSFFHSDLHIVIADPFRPGHEITYHPGETNIRMADVVVINKVDTADGESVEVVRKNVRSIRPGATIIDAASPLSVEGGEKKIRGRRVLVVEDGPTMTHGGMRFGAGYIAAREFGAAEILDPRPYAVGSIKGIYEAYPHLGPVLPAMGYTDQQCEELEQVINSAPCELVISGTPIDLGRAIKVRKPIVRVRYELQEIGKPDLSQVIDRFIARMRAEGKLK